MTLRYVAKCRYRIRVVYFSFLLLDTMVNSFSSLLLRELTFSAHNRFCVRDVLSTVSTEGSLPGAVWIRHVSCMVFVFC